MHPRTEEILNHLDASHAALEQAVAAVPIELRERKPAPDRWSVAEVLEHLAIVEQRVVDLLDNFLGSETAAGDLPQESDDSALAPMLDLSRVLDRSSPLIAGEAARPRDGLSAEAALRTLTARRARVRERIIAGDGKALGSIDAPHPRLGVLNLYQWLLFLGAHEARHTAQIREVMTAVMNDEG